MANVKAAIDYVLQFEDARLTGDITQEPGGAVARFGINSHAHPELENCLFYGSMGSMAALKIAESIYTKDYADPLCIAEIPNQALANKLLSLGVNCGVGTAGKMLQAILKVPGDGRIGPLTLNALDGANPDIVLAALKEAAVAHYRALVAANPALEQYLSGWIARAEA